MSHEITATDNMFSVREMPWHRLGVVLEDYPTRQQAQEIAHPWEPVEEPLYRAVPVITAEGGLETQYETVETLGNFRSDNGGYLGPKSPTYVTVKNGEMWDVAEALQGDNPDVMFETGGSLRGGKDVWIMVRLAEPLVVTGDPHGATMHYYLLQNKHDGSGAFKGSATATRVVCANTLRMADLDAELHGTEFSFSHTKNVAGRIEEAKEALAGWRESVQAWRLLTAHLVATEVSEAGVKGFLERFIPVPNSRVVSDRVRANVEADRAAWMSVYNSVTGEGIKNTAYGLLQASSEYAEHIRKAQSVETAFRRSIMNRNRIMTDAKDLALEAALA